MLKLDQLIFTTNSGKIRPACLKADDETVLNCAAGLINTYENAAACRMRRGELENMSAALIRSSAKPKVASGLSKLLLDGCEFTPPMDADYPALRKKYFTISAQALKAGTDTSALSGELETVGDIYGDLPDFEQLDSCRAYTPSELIDRFNLAQAQGLIMNTADLVLQISDPDISELRRVMKAVKFFRLLAACRMIKRNCLQITISGPYSLFGATSKYALSLASLLTVVVRLKKWSIDADVNIKGRQLKLKLSDKNGLRSRSRSFSSIVPEDIRMYHRLFAEKSCEWKITGDTPFIDAGDQEIIFPDLSFFSASEEKIVHLELFHRWHAAGLTARLELLHRRPELPLIIGIDRSLVKNNDLETLLEPYPELAERCWLFRDFPGVTNTLRALKNFSEAGKKQLFLQI